MRPTKSRAHADFKIKTLTTFQLLSMRAPKQKIQKATISSNAIDAHTSQFQLKLAHSPSYLQKSVEKDLH